MFVETVPGPPPSVTDFSRHALLFDLTGRAEIAVTGRDRAEFLHGLVTNEVKKLRPGEGCAAALLTPRGKMLADVTLLCAPEELIVDADPELARTLDGHLRKYVFFQQVALENRTGITGVLHIEGRGAGPILAKLVGQDGPSEPHASVVSAIGRAVRESRGGFEGYDLRVRRAEVASVRSAFVDAGALPAEPDVLEAARIEAGIPRWGADLTEDVLPDEAGLPARGYVSYTKGCYIGQETVARIKTYGHVNRRLVGLLLPAGDVPPRGAEIRKGILKVGAVTSAVRSERLDRAVALAYVHRDHVAPGTSLTVLCPGGPADAVVVSFPLAG
ncbi:MAG TPA: glycine cleavage T C-terminal barrel domain-containing protein [Thermoanaerobaculia bacterium]|nr:glycine cleavage T C-terminal barrel domain-containing protein [Thermoanaerobaculia bacterium]